MTFKPSVIKYPSGRYGYVGSIPEVLCDKVEQRSICGSEWKPKVFDSYQDAVDFANRNGIEIRKVISYGKSKIKEVHNGNRTE